MLGSIGLEPAWRRGAPLGAAAVALALLLATPVQAARVEVAPQAGDLPPRVAFAAGTGERNRLAVSYDRLAFIFDDVVAVTPGPGCERGADSTIARCTGPPTTPLTVDLGDSKDRYTATPGEVWGLGTVSYPRTAVTASTRVDGGPGSDAIGGGLGRDVLRGGAGDDSLRGPTPDNSADELFGGDGNDSAVAVGRNAVGPVPLALSLDDLPNDGRPREYPFEGDNLHADFENVISGPGDDTISPRWLGGTARAGDGNDTIHLGNSWGNTVYGEAGNDSATYAGQVLPVRASLDYRANDGPLPGGALGNLLGVENVTGGAGGDVIQGDAGNNRLDGRSGDDQVDGGPGGDQLSGGEGDDHLVGFDRAQFFSRDRLDCGGGRDSALFDRLDSLNADCELDYGAVMPLELEIATQIEVFAASRSFVLPFECLLGPDCVGAVRAVALVRPIDARALRAAPRRLTIARRSYRVRGGTRKRLRLRLTRSGRRLLRRVSRRRPARRARVRLTVTSTTKPPRGYRPSTARWKVRLAVKPGRPGKADSR